MPVEIVPSVLARTLPVFRARLAAAERLSRIIHVDVMDGQFVPTHSVGLDRLWSQSWHRPVELHLMVQRPEQWLELVLNRMVKEVIVHVEIGNRLEYALALFRSNKKRVRLAINPKTPLSRLWPWVKFSQGVQVMTVTPGRYRAPFQPGMIDRIKTIRARHPRLRISCDGGMTPRTIPAMVQAGADRCIVGSYIQYARHPEQAWQRLRAATLT